MNFKEENMNKKLQQLKEKENQLKAQIKNLEQIEKQHSKERQLRINMLLGSCIRCAVDEGLVSSDIIKECIRRYSKNDNDKKLLTEEIKL